MATRMSKSTMSWFARVAASAIVRRRTLRLKATSPIATHGRRKDIDVVFVQIARSACLRRMPRSRMRSTRQWRLISSSCNVTKSQATCACNGSIATGWTMRQRLPRRRIKPRRGSPSRNLTLNKSRIPIPTDIHVLVSRFANDLRAGNKDTQQQYSRRMRPQDDEPTMGSESHSSLRQLRFPTVPSHICLLIDDAYSPHLSSPTCMIYNLDGEAQ